MASTEIEILDPAATVEKVKRIAAGRALNRRNFLAAFGMTGVAAGAGLMSGCNATTTSVPVTSASPAETNLLAFALNLEYLEATFYSFITQGTDLPSNLTVGSGAVTGAVTMSNLAVGSSFNTEDIVIGIPTAALLSIGVITPGVALTATTTQTFTSPTNVTLKIPSVVTVTVSKGILTLSNAVTVSGVQTLTMLTGDIMDVEPFDQGTAAQRSEEHKSELQ